MTSNPCLAAGDNGTAASPLCMYDTCQPGHSFGRIQRTYRNLCIGKLKVYFLTLFSFPRVQHANTNWKDILLYT